MQILTKIFLQTFAVSKIISIFAPRLRNDANMVTVVQLVRASDCGSECRGFESHQSPKEILISQALMRIFSLINLLYYY